MRVRILVHNKPISRKEADVYFGKQRMEQRIKDAKETYIEDPFQTCSWMDGMEIIVTR